VENNVDRKRESGIKTGQSYAPQSRKGKEEEKQKKTKTSYKERKGKEVS